MARVSINIVAWNSMDFLPELLPSLVAQTYKDFSVLIIDNASSDGMEPWVREHFPQVTMLRNPRNLGFAAAHNQGVRFALNQSAEFVLVTNPDTILTPTFLEELLKDADAHPEAGSFSGKLLRAHVEHADDESLKEMMRSDRIDSTGIAAHRNRTFDERGAGELDRGQYDGSRDVFGATGALALYRSQALQDARYADEFFDYDFFVYKEDVDIAWRFQLLGWKARFVPEAVAYHHRNMYGAEHMGWVERIKNRMKKSRQRSFYSTRNHWDMLVKNELLWNALLASPWIVFGELRRFVYVILFEPKNSIAFVQAIARIPLMWKKRRATMKKRKATAKELRAWFV